MYACESPTFTAELVKRTQAFEIRRYRRLLNISCKDQVTNEDVRRKIQAAIGKYDELLTLVKKRKLRWFGHVSRVSGLAKTILQDTVQGKRKKSKQKKRWKDNIKEWKGLDFARSTRTDDDRTRSKGVGYKVICEAPMSSQGYKIDKTRYDLLYGVAVIQWI